LKGIQTELGCSNVELGIVDLSSFESVKQFAKTLEKDLNRLDILIANAARDGTVNVTADGFNET
jgi:NAD(P)-dependent dehydrogenase (short-subunit alcohol dehydrogenase family)